jgi:hypothetical protein
VALLIRNFKENPPVRYAGLCIFNDRFSVRSNRDGYHSSSQSNRMHAYVKKRETDNEWKREVPPPPSFFVDGILILMGLYDAYNKS